MLDGKVAVVTGGATGLGRCHALELARLGARVVVNDLGAKADGSGRDESAARAVCEEIRALGGEAAPHFGDVADFDAAKGLVETAVGTFGDLNVLVCNAGFLRDAILFNMTERDFDDVVRVHLKGHFCLARHACDHWRAEAKAGRPVDARIVNTSSGAGLQGSVGQSAYAAAKAGIAALTLVQAAELARYGITANAIAPSARTRMTEGVFADMMRKPEQGFDAMDPANVSPLVVWLGSAESRDVTGCTFEVAGGRISLADGWRTGPEVDRGARWEPDEIGAVVHELRQKAVPAQRVYGT